MRNRYSDRWFDVFARGRDAAVVEPEVAFLIRQLPQDRFPRILDVCCGTGQHAHRLARAGYRVTGLDRSEHALEEAERDAGLEAQFHRGDMRDLDALPGRFDGVICMWQSFGYFSDTENQAVLQGMRQRLRPGGRMILDVYDRRFLERLPSRREYERNGAWVREQVTLSRSRWRVRIDYLGDGSTDVFDWRVYTPDELAAVAACSGFALVCEAAGFDETCSPRGDRARIQLVFEVPGGP